MTKKDWLCWLGIHHYVLINQTVEWWNAPDNKSIYEQKICIRCGDKIDEIAELEAYRIQRRQDREKAHQMWKESEK